MTDFPLPDDLPVPADDGLADHLPKMSLPDITLKASDGRLINLAKLKGISVLYCYPMTGRPGLALPDGWDAIPGARGCTPQSCAFRDHYQDLQQLGVKQVFGISTQDTDYQKEAAERLHLPFAMLSDENYYLTKALNLPTMTVEDMTLIKRITLICHDNTITKVFYPVFPPNENATAVMEWLQASV